MKSHNLYDELMEEIDNIALLTDDKSVYYCQERLKTLIKEYGLAIVEATTDLVGKQHCILTKKKKKADSPVLQVTGLEKAINLGRAYGKGKAKMGATGE